MLRAERIRSAADLVVQHRPDLADVTRVVDTPATMARIDLPGGGAVVAAWAERQGVRQFWVVSPDGPDVPASTAEAMAQEMVVAYDRAAEGRLE
jgi:hypothetical protein